MTQFDARFCAQHRLIVLEDAGEQLVIGAAGKRDPEVQERIARIIGGSRPGTEIVYRRLEDSDFQYHMAALCGPGFAGTSAPKSETAGNLVRGDSVEISGIDTASSIITLLNSILTRAKASHASDIHIERNNDTAEIRLRTDGALGTLHTMDSATAKALVNRIKLIANLDTLENRRPQDGRFTITAAGKTFDIRVSAVPCAGGESVALRFLDTEESGIDLASLGFGETAYRLLAGLPRMRSGLVLITGPTGSGKTTTLSALVRLSSPSKRKVISIEDPVEYRIPGVVQIQTHAGIGLTFAELLRRIVRQDPDVLMIGEIRDDETAEQAVRAAMTGRLVFATLHARSVAEVPERLKNLGVDNYAASAVLCAVVGQRLVCTLPSGRIPVVEIALAKNGMLETVLSFTEEIVRCRAGGLAGREQLEEVFGVAQ